MSSSQLLSPPVQPVQADVARVQFRRPASRVGSVDAAWWPHSLDLPAELPALLEVVWSDSHPITRVTYNIGTWGQAPRRIAIAGRMVRLGGFVAGEPFTIKLSDAWRRESIDILVIAPNTDAAVAQRIFELASTADNPDSVAEILARTQAEGSS